MIKKSYIVLLIILTIINSTILVGYCSEIAQPTDDPIIYNYIYKDVDRISSEIDLLAKTIFLNEDNESNKEKEKNLKQIKFLTTQINYTLKEIQGKYDEYADNKFVLNGLYAISLMFDEYRFSLTRLEEYILSDTSEEKYSNLQFFFTVNSQAISKLNAAKTAIPK